MLAKGLDCRKYFTAGDKIKIKYNNVDARHVGVKEIVLTEFTILAVYPYQLLCKRAGSGYRECFNIADLVTNNLIPERA